MGPPDLDKANGDQATMTTEEAVRLIQVHERARQGRLRAKLMKEIRYTCMYVCMYVGMYVCRYVCRYVRTYCYKTQIVCVLLSVCARSTVQNYRLIIHFNPLSSWSTVILWYVYVEVAWSCKGSIIMLPLLDIC